MNRLFSRFKSDIVGLFWMAMGLFVALSLMSYHPSDPSFNSIGGGPKIYNYCGYMGSYLADVLYQFFGLSAWLMVGLPLHSSMISFLGRSSSLKNEFRWIWSLLFFFTSCSLIGLYLPETRIFSHKIPAAGLAGIVISKGLVKIFNFAGVAVILWTSAAMLMIFYTERSLKELLSAPFKSLKMLGLKLTRAVKWMNRMEGLSSSDLGRSLEFSAPLNSGKISPDAKESKTLYFPFVSRKKGNSSSSSSLAEAESTRLRSAEIQTNSPSDSTEGPELSGFLFKSSRAERSPIEKKIRRKAVSPVENWSLPHLSLLADSPKGSAKVDEKEIKIKAKILVDKLGQFSVRGSVVGIKPGPAITLFEFKPAADVKISRITDLADDLSLALSSESVRIIAPIPGRDVVGIETSNPQRETVLLKDILMQEEFWAEEMKLPIALGRQADGEPKVVDLRKMPHMLVAGSTGSGKSVFVVGLLAGLLFRHSPRSLRLILVDPKQVDLAVFSHCPHLIMPPVRESQKAVGALKWAIREMDKRYRSMSKFGARGLESFNEIVNKLSAEEKLAHEKFNMELQGAARLDEYYYEAQPYIVIVVEEFGDLMAVDKANVESAVVRLAQMARACGIHLIIAMQSPRRDVVTGLIKTNIPGRVSFKVASKMDSRIILDESGAERLLTRGDMLYLAPGVAKPERHHGAFVSERELKELTDYWSSQGKPKYDSLALKILEGNVGSGFDFSQDQEGDGSDSEYDDRYDEILSYVATQKEISASLIQRKFRIGYPRAARLIEMLESEGVVGPVAGSKPRRVLVSPIK